MFYARGVPQGIFTGIRLPLDERASLEARAASLNVSLTTIVRAGLRSIHGAYERDVELLIEALPPDGRHFSGHRLLPCGRDAVLNAIPKAPRFVEQADLDVTVGGDWRGHLKALCDEGRVIRTGRGVRHEPYRYHLAAEALYSPRNKCAPPA